MLAMPAYIDQPSSRDERGVGTWLRHGSTASELRAVGDAYNDLEIRLGAAINSSQTEEYERLLAEQSKLLVFRPLVGHSLSEMEAPPYYFHPQLVVDFLTVEELGEKMLVELRGAK